MNSYIDIRSEAALLNIRIVNIMWRTQADMSVETKLIALFDGTIIAHSSVDVQIGIQKNFNQNSAE